MANPNGRPRKPLVRRPHKKDKHPDWITVSLREMTKAERCRFMVLYAKRKYPQK